MTGHELLVVLWAFVAAAVLGVPAVLALSFCVASARRERHAPRPPLGGGEHDGYVPQQQRRVVRGEVSA